MANPRKPLDLGRDPERVPRPPGSGGQSPPAPEPPRPPDVSDDREFAPEEWDPELTVNPTGDEGDDGAVPGEESSFADTPVTVSTGHDVLPEEGEPPLTI